MPMVPYAMATKPIAPAGMHRRPSPLTQILDMQQRAREIAMDTSQKPSVACFAMRSFCSLQEERRKLQMRPLPKPVDVSKEKRGRRQAGPSAPAYQEPDVAPELHTKPKPAQAPKPQG